MREESLILFIHERSLFLREEDSPTIKQAVPSPPSLPIPPEAQQKITSHLNPMVNENARVEALYPPLSILTLINHLLCYVILCCSNP